MPGEVERVEPTSGTLALSGDQVEWTPVQRAALAHIGIEDAPAADQAVFMHVAQRTGLDPFARQIYMIGRREKQPDGSYKIKWVIQTGIDGFRLIAERHPQFAGTLDPEWCGPDGVWHDAWVDKFPPVAARVQVLRHDREHPIALPVRFVEFADTFPDGNLRAQWKVKPAHMIGKVAEATSLRKAFPQDFSGIYIPEEMDAAEAHAARRTVVEHRAAPTVEELTGNAGVFGPRGFGNPQPEGSGAGVVDTEAVAVADEPEQVAEQSPAAVVDEPQEPDVVDAEQVRQRRMKRLFALLRDVEVGDRKTYAAGVLGRPVPTYQVLTLADIEQLIGNLEDLRSE